MGNFVSMRHNIPAFRVGQTGRVVEYLHKLHSAEMRSLCYHSAPIMTKHRTATPARGSMALRCVAPRATDNTTVRTRQLRQVRSSASPSASCSVMPVAPADQWTYASADTEIVQRSDLRVYMQNYHVTCPEIPMADGMTALVMEGKGGVSVRFTGMPVIVHHTIRQAQTAFTTYRFINNGLWCGLCEHGEHFCPVPDRRTRSPARH